MADQSLDDYARDWLTRAVKEATRGVDPRKSWAGGTLSRHKGESRAEMRAKMARAVDNPRWREDFLAKEPDDTRVGAITDFEIDGDPHFVCEVWDIATDESAAVAVSHSKSFLRWKVGEPRSLGSAEPF